MINVELFPVDNFSHDHQLTNVEGFSVDILQRLVPI